jgi:hypothetical protein
MYRELYAKDLPPDDAQIVAALIEQAVVLARVDLDLTVQYLTDGLMATVYLKPPHNTPWHILWKHEQSRMIDTGIDPMPSLADPRIQELLTESIQEIFTRLYAFCHCPSCRMKGVI